MPAPKGNKNAKGKKNPNAGRKTQYQEFQDAYWLFSVFFGETEMAKLQLKIKSGKFSPRDVFLYKMMGGNERLLSDAFKKLVPDMIDLRDMREVDNIEELEQKVQGILDGMKKKAVDKAMKRPVVAKMKK